MSAAPDRFGPYRVVATLGRGGMGIVYKARHEKSGAFAAVKTLRAASDLDLQGIKREVVALARLRHPGIVRIVDHGLAGGLPWYAMELHEGTTLRARIRSAGGHDSEEGQWTTSAFAQPTQASAPTTVDLSRDTMAVSRDARLPAAQILDPADLRQTLTIIRRLCAPLEFLHGEGIVHRDLKPDNVLLRAGGMPVLLDFGLASVRAHEGELQRESLMGTGELSGTLPYMSPEQCRGESVDARSDLYALGCILFELLAGRPPFVAESPMQLLYQHIQAQPPRLSRVREGIPAGLDDLVDRLLQKEPRARPGYASDVAGALGSLGAEDGLAASGPRPRPYVYRPALAGRDDAVTPLRDRLERLRAGSGAIVLVGGESGVGKTRLVSEIVVDARRRGQRVLMGECAAAVDGRAATPLQGLSKVLELLVDGCRGQGGAMADQLFGSRGPVLAPYEPSILALPGQGSRPAPADLPPEAARARLWGAFAQTLQAAAVTQPLVVAVDDLHWADDLTLGFLAYVARAGMLEGAPVLLVGTYRTEEAPAALAELAAGGTVGHVTLARLGQDEVARIAADMLALPSVPAELARHLALQSEGNPLFVAEYLRAGIAEGKLVRSGLEGFRMAAAASALSLPATLRDLVSHRVATLPPELRAVVEAASVLGREVAMPLLAQVAELSEEALAAGLARLVARQIVEDAGAGCRFTHDKLRETALDAIAPERRRYLHRRAAMALEESGPAAGGAARLAAHWHEAGHDDRARPHYLAAAREAGARHALAEAERLYRLHRDLTPPTGPGADDADAALELATRVLEPRGRFEESEHVLGDGLALCQRLGDGDRAVRATRCLAHAVIKRGRQDEALELYETALGAARARGDAAETALCLRGIAEVRTNEGRMEDACALIEEAIALLLPTSRKDLLHDVRADLAIHLHSVGQLPEARLLQEELHSQARAMGDRVRAASSCAQLASIARHQGRRDDAEELYGQAIDAYRDIGDWHGEVFALTNKAVLLQTTGRPERARVLYEEAAGAARAMGMPRVQGAIAVNLATLHFEEGRLDEAQALYERSLVLLRQSGDRRSEAYSIGNMAWIAARRGCLDEALARCEEATALARATEDRLLEGELLSDQSSFLLRAGQVEAARDAGESSLAMSRQVGNRRGIGMVLIHLARIARLQRRLAHAATLVAEAEDVHAALGDDVHLGIALCEHGLIALAEGTEAVVFLERARGLRAPTAGPGASLGEAIDELEGAMKGGRS